MGGKIFFGFVYIMVDIVMDLYFVVCEMFVFLMVEGIDEDLFVVGILIKMIEMLGCVVFVGLW